MTMTHYMKAGAGVESTACGLLHTENRRTTKRRNEVTCRRCLITMLPYPLTDKELRDSERPDDAQSMIGNVLIEAMKQTMNLVSFQERSHSVVKRLIAAKTANAGIKLSASEVDDLTIVIALLNAK